jgi:hypothetical protein
LIAKERKKQWRCQQHYTGRPILTPDWQHRDNRRTEHINRTRH